jgi:hypothetical protein
VTTQIKNTIVKGSDIDISVFLQTEDCNGIILPYNLTGKTLEVVYKNGAGALVTKVSPDVQVIDAVYANIILTLTEADTDALKTGYFDFDVIIEDGADTKIWKFIKEVTVIDRIR